ncbi:MAG: ABC transporter permease [Verrucomicrobia bacterium]|nr:ABC transporter permease [Verrucomicrobiota bacterium]
MAEASSSRWIGAPPNGWQVLRRNRVAMLSLWFVVAVALFAVVTPFCLSEETKIVGAATFQPPAWCEGGTWNHWLGTDANGRDLLYQIAVGAQVSLGVGLIGALISLIIGGVYGMISGYAGGRVDGAMMRLVDILNSVPSLLFVMIFISAFDDRIKDSLDAVRLWAQSANWHWLETTCNNLAPYKRIFLLVLSLGFVQWLTMARIVRGQVLVLKELAFVTAARSMGQHGWSILWKHLWPNLSTIVLTYLTLTIPAVIRDESFLSFLGLGIEDPASSWGSLLKEGAQVINPLESKWWLLAFPAALMSASLLALNFLGDGLRDAFDPRSND